MKKLSQFFLPMFLQIWLIFGIGNIFGNPQQDSLWDTQTLDELILLGSRGKGRIQTDAPVPVDILKISSMVKEVAQPDLGQMLNYTQPSFTSAAQTVADGTDHIDPAALRGLNPDQTLVLLNGKRRHSTALLNINGTFGRGSVGTDLNVIPALAVANIEVLRDGAAAQYGSDAVAGVINITLKQSLGTTVLLNAGANMSTFESYTEATKGNYQKDQMPGYIKNRVYDGQLYQVGINHGLALGKEGFLNLTLALGYRGPTNRSGEATGSITANSGSLNLPVLPTAAKDETFLKARNLTRKNFRNRAGQSEVTSAQFFFNGRLPVHNSYVQEAAFYFFGGLAFKNGKSAANFRKPGLALVPVGIYPNGFLPIINSKIWDPSLAVGYEFKIDKWSVDIANVIGANIFDFSVNNTINSTAANPVNIAQRGTLAIDSNQTRFDAGILGFIQNNLSLDIVRSFSVLEGLNVAFGALYRYEAYLQRAGEPGSYANYNRRGNDLFLVDINGSTVLSGLSYTPNLGLSRRNFSSSGSQGFTGFAPENRLTETRHNTAFYVDLEQNITKTVLVNAAGRYEYYSDFGSNLSGKIAARVKITPAIAWRGAISTGFRAPALQQRYFRSVSLVATGGSIESRGTFSNASTAAKEVGIQSLKPEISYNFSTGFTFKAPDFSASLDAYLININDRVIYTGAFQKTPELTPIFDRLDVSRGQFLTNGINTRTYGVDLVLNYHLNINNLHKIRLTLAGNYNKSELRGGLKTGPLLQNQAHIFFSPNAASYMFNVLPRFKAFFTANYKIGKWHFLLKEGLFGTTTHIDDNGNSFYKAVDAEGKDKGTDNYVYIQRLSSVFTTDISVSYDITRFLTLTLGTNNLFDAYNSVIEASRGRFYRIETDPAKAGYNTVSTQGLSAKEIGWFNSDRLTGGTNIGNQFNYSRRIATLGMNGRYVFVRVLVHF